METWEEMLFSSKSWAPCCHLQKYPLLYLGYAKRPCSQECFSDCFYHLIFFPATWRNHQAFKSPTFALPAAR